MAYETLGWVPSNIYAQQNTYVQQKDAAVALMEQQQYSHHQGYYHGSYWSKAQLLGYGISDGAFTK